MSHPDYASEAWLKDDGIEVAAPPDLTESPLSEPYSMDGSSKRPRKYLLYGTVGLVAVGAAVVAALVVSGSAGTGSNGLTSGGINDPTAAPTVFEDTTPGPTPTTASEVRELILKAARKGGIEFEDSESYQSRALQWVMTQDLPLPEFSALSMEQEALQLYALACIYYSTNAVRNSWTDYYYGPDAEVSSWFSSVGWLGDASEVCSSWFGITCDSSKRVAKIQLASNGMTGSFPPETAYLADSLRYLDLFNNLVHNQGDEGNSFLGELTNLQYLFYGTTSFEYDGIPTEIARLTNLVEYDFSYSLYYGQLREGIFGQLSNLEYVVMSGNGYSSTLPADLVSLPKLEYLYAEDCFLQGDFNFVSQMPSIRVLWADNNRDMAGPLPSTLGEATTLESFAATGNGLTGTIPTELGQLTDLVQFWVYDNSLTGTVPTEFAALRKLQEMGLQGNQLGGSMPAQICSMKAPGGRLVDFIADCDVCPEDSCCTCCGVACLDEN